jgi:hypothetical protein
MKQAPLLTDEDIKQLLGFPAIRGLHSNCQAPPSMAICDAKERVLIRFQTARDTQNPSLPQRRCRWPDRFFVPDAMRDYCMFAVSSSSGGGVVVMGAGGR